MELWEPTATEIFSELVKVGAGGTIHNNFCTGCSGYGGFLTGSFYERAGLWKKQQVELNAFPNKVFGTRSFASD